MRSGGAGGGTGEQKRPIFFPGADVSLIFLTTVRACVAVGSGPWLAPAPNTVHFGEKTRLSAAPETLPENGPLAPRAPAPRSRPLGKGRPKLICAARSLLGRKTRGGGGAGTGGESREGSPPAAGGRARAGEGRCPGPRGVRGLGREAARALRGRGDPAGARARRGPHAPGRAGLRGASTPLRERGGGRAAKPGAERGADGVGAAHAPGGLRGASSPLRERGGGKAAKPGAERDAHGVGAGGAGAAPRARAAAEALPWDLAPGLALAQCPTGPRRQSVGLARCTPCSCQEPEDLEPT